MLKNLLKYPGSSFQNLRQKNVLKIIWRHLLKYPGSSLPYREDPACLRIARKYDTTNSQGFHCSILCGYSFRIYYIGPVFLTNFKKQYSVLWRFITRQLFFHLFCCQNCFEIASQCSCSLRALQFHGIF